MSNAQFGEQYGQALRQYLAAQGDLLQALIKLGGELEVTKFVNALQRSRVLNEQIAVDSRQFNLVSSTLKAKHDAAKNALHNVRQQQRGIRSWLACRPGGSGWLGWHPARDLWSATSAATPTPARRVGE
jgi:hypothetical protein